jgi:DNA adenine methylase
VPKVEEYEDAPATATNGRAATRAGRLVPPLKTHGGKSYLARRIIALMPRHQHYNEPFAGGLAVLLTRDPNDRRLWWGDTSATRGVSEVVNDRNGRLIIFWRVLQRPDLFKQFQRVVQAVPFSEAEWQDSEARLDDPDPVERAVAFFVRCRQSLAGRMKAFAGISRTRTRGGRNEQANAWWGAVEGLPAVHKRLSAVVLYNRPALDVIRSEDGPRTLHYCDPPYLHSTRAVADTYGPYEMTEADHRELLDVVNHCRGKVMLSAYRSSLYDHELAGWVRHDFDIANHAAGGGSKRRMTECLWCNFRR